MRALLLGRFQPFHNGHLKVVKEITEDADYLVIALGSAQYSHSLENPFSAGERYTMISRALMAQGIENYHLVTIEDLHRYAAWVSHVVSQSPKFDVVYAHNPLSLRLFTEGGFTVRNKVYYTVEIVSRPRYNRMIINLKAAYDSGGQSYNYKIKKNSSTYKEIQEMAFAIKDLAEKI